MREREFTLGDSGVKIVIRLLQGNDGNGNSIDGWVDLKFEGNAYLLCPELDGQEIDKLFPPDAPPMVASEVSK